MFKSILRDSHSGIEVAPTFEGKAGAGRRDTAGPVLEEKYRALCQSFLALWRDVYYDSARSGCVGTLNIACRLLGHAAWEALKLTL